MNENLQISEETVRRRLEQHPLYEPGDAVHCLVHDGNYLIGWRGRSGRIDVQAMGDVFYILNIEIAPHLRGSGLGERLYLTLEKLAQDCSCHIVEQTASGWTPTGETRGNYLTRKLGYRLDGSVARKQV